MKNTFFLILFLSSFASAEELIFQCEDGYSYKITTHEKSVKQAFLKIKQVIGFLLKILIFQIKNFI